MYSLVRCGRRSAINAERLRGWVLRRPICVQLLHGVSLVKLDFLTMELSGFGSFLSKQRFTLGYNQPGLAFVRGRNEVEPRLGANDAGKSTLFNALCWGLFGHTVNNLRNPDIKPWSNKNDTLVTIPFLKDGKKQVVQRSLSPKHVLLFNGKEVAQDHIDEALGFGFDLFCNTILLGQGRPLFFDKTPSEKLELLSDTLGLTRWEDRSGKASEQALNLNNEKASLEGEVRGLEAALEQAQGLLKAAKERSTAWEAEHQQTLKDRAKIIADMEKRRNSLEVKLGEVDLAYDGAMTELKACLVEKDKLVKLVMDTNHAHLLAEEAVKSVQREYDRLEAELKTLDKAKKCPTCGQVIKQDALGLSKHKKEIEKRLADLEDPTVLAKADKAKAAWDAATGKLADCKKYTEVFRERATRHEEELNHLKPVVTELTTKIITLTDIARKEEINPHREEIQTLRRKVQQHETELEALDKDIVTITRKMERSKYWVKGFKDVRLFIIEEFLQELELATNSMLPESGLIDWEVHYDVEKETKKGTVQRGLNVTVLSPRNREAVRWEAWGGGVGQRLRIVGALALADTLLAHVGIQNNLEILDEPTKHLSTEGVQDICAFLAERARQQNKNIFYVDHKAVESAHFSDVLTVVKTKEGSHIEID